MHLLTLLLAGVAAAQDAVSLDVIKVGQVGTSSPGLYVTVNQAAEQLAVDVSCAGKPGRYSGPAAAGRRIELRIDVPVGTHTCSGRLAGEFADGTSGEMPLSFKVTMHPKMTIQLVNGTLDLTAKKLSVATDRPVARVEIAALGLKGAEVGGTSWIAPGGSATRADVSWADDGREVLKLRVRAFDGDGFWSELELSPWSYTVPHEDVVFASDSAVIAPEEARKLDTALADAKAVVEKYGADVVIKLYVGGHTDTVGDGAHNAELSGRRAKAIARWFKDRGFPGEIFYAGFGESDLAVATADGVDEARNRRASYVLSARPPGRGGSGDSGWRALD